MLTFQPRKPPHRRPRHAEPPSAPPVDGPLVLHVVRATPSTYVFEFDRPVVASTPPGGDSNLNVNGMMPVNAGNLDSTHVVIEFGADAPPASPWAITGALSWIVPAPAVPQSGVTEAPHVSVVSVQTLGEAGDAVRVIFSGPVALADPMFLPAGGFRTNGEGVPEDAVVEQAASDTVDIQADSWAGSRVPGVPWQVIYPPEFLDGTFSICDNGAGNIESGEE
jgi:hypothetical protein